MTQFQIRNAITKAELGVYEADTQGEALDKMARAGRFQGFSQLAREVPWVSGGILIEELRNVLPKKGKKSVGDAV